MEDPISANNLENSANSSQIERVNYVGFWKRIVIALIDGWLMFLFEWGAIELLNIHNLGYGLIILVNMFLYFYYGRTVGDFVMQTKLVKAGSVQKPSILSLIGRYFAKFISLIVLGVGFMFAGWTNEKKAWHDSMSGTRYIEVKSYNGIITWILNIFFW